MNAHAVADMALWFRVQAFLALEARLQDDHHLTDWLPCSATICAIGCR